jgi:hypothetical protein
MHGALKQDVDDNMPIELISAFVGLILTLLVFSYLIGDNPLFRIAIHLFIGVSSGYAAVVICNSVLLPRLRGLPLNDTAGLILGLIPLILGVTLIAKLSPRISWLGSFALALLVGVGAATALSGAVVGTLLPQSFAAMDALDLRSSTGGADALLKMIEGSILLAGTVLTLVYFQFSAKRLPDGSVKRNVIVEFLAWLGRIFIAVTLGTLFAGVYMAVLAALIERLSAVIGFVRPFLGL